jgi:hypothetical protein
LGKPDKEEAIQSALKRSDTDLKRSNNRFKALESAANLPTDSEKREILDEYYADEGSAELTELSQPVELQKESLQLGVAAGYTGRAIREIESSLNRIERGMASREWIQSNLGDNSKIIGLLAEIKDVLEKHDSNALKRFEAIEIALNRMILTAEGAPEPLKKELITEIESIRATLPLTPKMKRLVAVVKDSGKISYDDLASQLNITRSSLRGLLANTMKRTTEIERFSVGGKGWVRYKHPKTTQIDTFS